MAEQLPDRSFRVVDYSVDHESGSYAYFERRLERHREHLSRFFTTTGGDYRRFNYLGEWHSHPSFSVRPSRTDLTAMQALLQEPHIDFAMLLIVRLSFGFWLSTHAELFTREGVRAEVSIT